MNSSFDKRETLNIIYNLIDNCDTKTSICLSAYAVVISVVLSSNFAEQIINVLNLAKKSATAPDIIYIIIMVGSVLVSLTGLYKLFTVLVPVIDTTHESIMFFGNIGLYKSFSDYKLEVERFSPEQISDDILHQIYIASKICCQKFNNQRKGMFLLGIGTMIFLVLYIVGLNVYSC